MKIAVLGASGYIGGRLIPELLTAGHSVVALSRDPAKLEEYPWRAEVEIRRADLLDPASLPPAIAGCDAVYYLVHSLGERGFDQREAAAARHLADATAASDVGQIVYLGGLGDGDLSRHLRSRQEVGRILADGPVPVTELRAAVIIGSGSLSFEMIRYLAEVLPVMTTPKWVQTRCQPLAIADVLAYLIGVLGRPEAYDRILEVGGADVLTYEGMMQGYAQEAGLRRRLIISIPFLPLELSAWWVQFVTPLSGDIARQLVSSLQTEVVADTAEIERLLPSVRPVGYRTAISRAIRSTQGADVPTRWTPTSWDPSDPLPSDPDYAFGTIFTDVREVETTASPEDVAWAFMGVGGGRGYYSAAWAWKIRGLIDQLFGGAGLRRGRRHPDQLRPGEALDFWRVVGIDPGRALRLRAEMSVPGKAWLEWEVSPTASGSKLVQTATYVPRGLWGRLYWFAMTPFHAIVFPQMVRGIASAAEMRLTSDQPA